MTQQNTTETERLWTYDAVRVGQAGGVTEVTMSDADVAEYAACAQNPDPRYRMPPVGSAAPPLLAMPTMALTYAPLLREEIAEANGFVAQERSTTARRQTPFAKGEVRWYRPVYAGETITSTRRVYEKYERRGSKFVTFRVSAFGESGAVVASSDYTCIFEYVAGPAGGSTGGQRRRSDAGHRRRAGSVPIPDVERRPGRHTTAENTGRCRVNREYPAEERTTARRATQSQQHTHR